MSLGVVAVNDKNKGEKIVLVTAEKNVQLAEIRKYFKNAGLSELWCPKEIFYLKNLPLLGSGKFDYLTAKKLLEN